jgi:phage baseplate assembly protein W
MTVANIENNSRRILQDTQTPYRWTSEEMREALQEGISALNAVRPETRYVGGNLYDYIDLPKSNTEEIQVKPRYKEALVYYVVYKCYLNDSTDTMNAQLAEMYLGKFNTKIQL